MGQARSARAINQREKNEVNPARAGKETSRSQVEGSPATKIGVSKSAKLNLLGCLKYLLARFKQFYKFM